MLLKLMMDGGKIEGRAMADDHPMKPFRIIDDIREVSSHRLDTGEMAIDVNYKSENRGLFSETFILSENAYLMNDSGKTVQTFWTSNVTQPRTTLNQEEYELFDKYKQFLALSGLNIKAEASFVEEYAATKRYALLISMEAEVANLTAEEINKLTNVTRQWEEEFFPGLTHDQVHEQGIIISYHNKPGVMTGDFREWVSNRPHVSRNVITVITVGRQVLTRSSRKPFRKSSSVAQPICVV